MGKTGREINKQFNRLIDDPGAGLENLGRNLVGIGSLGLADIEDGKLKFGPTVKGLDEGLGEITGRNVAREQLALAREQIQREELQRQELIVEEKAFREQSDIAASRAAGATRQRGRSQRGDRTFTSGSRSGVGKDFLGR